MSYCDRYLCLQTWKVLLALLSAPATDTRPGTQKKIFLDMLLRFCSYSESQWGPMFGYKRSSKYLLMCAAEEECHIGLKLYEGE